MKQSRSLPARMLAGALVMAVAFAAQPVPSARAASGVLDQNLTVGLLVVVVGVLGWVAWHMEQEDRADSLQSSALLPLYAAEDRDLAFGLIWRPETRDESRAVYTAGLAGGRRF